MVKNIYYIFFFISALGYAQVGINTTAPQGTFHIDGAKDNSPATAPTVAQQANDFIIKADGKVGIGTISPQVNCATGK